MISKSAILPGIGLGGYAAPTDCFWLSRYALRGPTPRVMVVTGPGGGVNGEMSVCAFAGGKAGFKIAEVKPICSGTQNKSAPSDIRPESTLSLTLPIAGVMSALDLPPPNALQILSPEHEGCIPERRRPVGLFITQQHEDDHCNGKNYSKESNTSTDETSSSTDTG